MPDTLTVVMTRWGDVQSQIEHLSRGACFVPLPDPLPEPFEDLEVLMVTPGGSFQFEAQVMQLLPPVGMALACKDPAAVRAWLEGMHEARGEDESDADPYVQWGRPDSVEPDLPEPEPDREQPIHDKIAEMTTSAKLQLALHGD